MLDNLTNRLSRIVKTMRGEARLTESNTQEMLREVRMALLEADVALPIVRDFIAQVKEKALGQEVVNSLNPGQALVGIVHRELAAVMGGDLGEHASELSLATQPPAVILMAGLQGAGKTTTVGKLAKWLKEGDHVRYGRKTGKKKVLVVSADVYRPAAIAQLQTVAEQVQVDFLPSDASQTPQTIATGALEYARRHHYEVLLVDTAGRLGVDAVMMEEIRSLHALLQPIETLFVVDAMQGQDAVNVAKAFGDALPLTGVVLTKLDGDARGGAALSVRHITGKAVKFVGVSEKLDGLEPFYPERMAKRILGMGDVVALVEQVEKTLDTTQAASLAKRLQTGRFNLGDFRTQLEQFRTMGSLSDLMDKLPMPFARNTQKVQDDAASQKQLRHTMGIIDAMTPQERAKPEILKASRKRRIAAGAGVPVQEVNRVLMQFQQAQGMMKQMHKFKGKGNSYAMKLLRALG